MLVEAHVDDIVADLGARLEVEHHGESGFGELHEIELGGADKVEHGHGFEPAAFEEEIENQARDHERGEKTRGHTDSEGDAETFDGAGATKETGTITGLTGTAGAKVGDLAFSGTGTGRAFSAAVTSSTYAAVAATTMADRA